jgi:hypothetical protein
MGMGMNLRALMFLGFAGLVAQPALSQQTPAQAVFEMVMVPPASADVAQGLFRINVSTGQVVTAWGYVKTYTVIAESAPLPAGEYHLHFTESLDRKGSWYLYRFDANSGRIWVAVGGGNAPFAWNEIAAP